MELNDNTKFWISLMREFHNVVAKDDKINIQDLERLEKRVDESCESLIIEEDLKELNKMIAKTINKSYGIDSEFSEEMISKEDKKVKIIDCSELSLSLRITTMKLKFHGISDALVKDVENSLDQLNKLLQKDGNEVSKEEKKEMGKKIHTLEISQRCLENSTYLNRILNAS